MDCAPEIIQNPQKPVDASGKRCEVYYPVTVGCVAVLFSINPVFNCNHVVVGFILIICVHTETV